MALSDSSYSRLVAWLKLILPLLALGILSILFFLARTVDPELSIGIAEEDVVELANQSRLSAPSYLGVGPDGTAISLTAASARPDPQQDTMLLATDVSGRIEPQDGSWVTLRSDNARLDTSDSSVRLMDSVVLETSTGLRVEAESLDASLEAGEVSSKDRVTATAPFGTLTANAMRYTSDADGGDQNLLVFSDGVKLIYQPAN